MRSFPVIYLSVFLVFYLLISFVTYKTLKAVVGNRFLNTVKVLYILYNFILAIGFVYLYIYPNQPRNVTNYTPYFYFNFILFTDLAAKIMLTLFFILHTIFRRKSGKIFLYAGFILSCGLVLNTFYGAVFGNRSLEIEKFEIEFETLPASFDNYRIVQISDIHLGSFADASLLEQTHKALSKLSPDLLIFTGDMVNNFATEITEWKDYLTELTTGIPSYSILGNHDYGDYSSWKSPAEKQKNFGKILLAQQEMGFNLLRNEHAILKKGTDSLYLAGVENWGHEPFPQYADLDEALKKVPEDAFVILLTHDPAHWESKVKYDPQIDLVFSGHTHGLQWGIKPAGIPFSLSYLTRKNWGGLYKSENSPLIVSTGLGNIGIPWRIDMPPKLTTITLKRREVN